MREGSGMDDYNNLSIEELETRRSIIEEQITDLQDISNAMRVAMLTKMVKSYAVFVDDSANPGGASGKWRIEVCNTFDEARGVAEEWLRKRYPNFVTRDSHPAFGRHYWHDDSIMARSVVEIDPIHHDEYREKAYSLMRE